MSHYPGDGSDPDLSLQELDPDEDTPEPQPTQKRKGGRKPIYATSEERKQRNRQAQADFRHRRTEYIKHLELTLKQNEHDLECALQDHRSAADECSSLKAKVRALERMLLERGVDVRSEMMSQDVMEPVRHHSEAEMPSKIPIPRQAAYGAPQAHQAVQHHDSDVHYHQLRAHQGRHPSVDARPGSLKLNTQSMGWQRPELMSSTTNQASTASSSGFPVDEMYLSGLSQQGGSSMDLSAHGADPPQGSHFHRAFTSAGGGEMYNMDYATSSTPQGHPHHQQNMFRGGELSHNVGGPGKYPYP